MHNYPIRRQGHELLQHFQFRLLTYHSHACTEIIIRISNSNKSSSISVHPPRVSYFDYKMAEFVEGDWKNFTFKMAKPEDYPGILEHLRESFYLDEPVSKMMGQSELKNQDMDNYVTKNLDKNLSFFAIDRNNNNKIVGVRVIGISRKDDDPMENIAKTESPEILDLLPNIASLLEDANTFEKFGIDHYGDFIFVSVDREYRGQGLATEIFHRAIKMLKAKGFPAVQSTFSNPHTQNIAKKLGFVELARRKFKDYTKQDGSSMFPQAGDDEIAIVMTKLI